MANLRIHPEHVNVDTAKVLTALCPFGSIHYQGDTLQIDSGCKMCGLCVKKGPPGAITLEEDTPVPKAADKSAWRGVAVYAEVSGGHIHNVSLELIGKARELAKLTGHPVHAVLLGCGLEAAAEYLLHWGVDAVYCCDHPELADFRVESYAAAFSYYIETIKPSSILVGATAVGRSLAPRVAARFRTGLTADCTMLEMKENTDLVQIRPAFGGNIMARIVTPNHRPQLCTVRYKIFRRPERLERASGSIVRLAVPDGSLVSAVEALSKTEKPKLVDISEARAIVAVGRGLAPGLYPLARELAGYMGAQLACTRPLIESGAFDPRRQIGLSGRTVGAEVIVTLGISGSVQFVAGMRGCGCIIAVNRDEKAPIFDVAHYAAIGDLGTVLPGLVERCKEEKGHGVQ